MKTHPKAKYCQCASEDPTCTECWKPIKLAANHAPQLDSVAHHRLARCAAENAAWERTLEKAARRIKDYKAANCHSYAAEALEKLLQDKRGASSRITEEMSASK